ncbi:ribosome recycling factor [Clostridium sartagoforme]|uniref:Ribosome-recycling factor n=1 Tax=Clostridium sartagoforme TaxID=84031 RepID=A0A4V3RLJ3_9CLOT|nr:MULTISPECIES: ribosome recycling factor [Clostridium]MBS4804505.1 ribosome recycling factor [Clostridium sp.]MBS5937776.1 ribosome recycling factor [Clostridium sp.]MBS5950287.1 ribosome recycling factor [Clostridium sp.]MDU5109660.1 ribosome recycling factor [Clostridium sp.]TGY43970.1 ribosome recycling factor [Clostridium sartagoforme]
MIKDIIQKADEKMNKTISVLKSDLSTLRAGRANPTMLDRIKVDYYGSPCPLSQVANISAPEPRVLVIAPWEKSLMKEIEKAILTSDLGINPSNDGSVIRLVVPELTEETRKNLVKVVKKTGEEAKVALRSIRRDANDKVKALKKDGEITEDEQKNAEDKVQKIIDSASKEVDTIVAAKEKEIMSI